MMSEVPVSGAIARYRGRRLRIVFSGDDWVAVRAEPGEGIPDGFESGESSVGQGHMQPWVKVPRTSLDGIVHQRVTGKIAGHPVTLRERTPDGQIRVTFMGSPSVAREIGLTGDQYMGWTGLFPPEELEDIRVEETRRA